MKSRLAFFLPTLVAAIPALYWLGVEMGKAGDARWGALALVAGFVLVVRECGFRSEPGGRVLVIAALSLYVGLWYFGFRAFAAGAALLAIAGSLLDRRPIGQIPMTALALVLLGLPFLRDLHYVGGFPLRLASAELSAFLLQLQGLDVHRIGTGLLWRDMLIEVDAPCSGIKMLWTSTFLAFFASSWLRLSNAKTILVLVLVPIVVLAANVIRCTALFHLESGLLDAPSWTHEGTGVLVFAGSAMILLLTARKLAPSGRS